MDCTATEHLTQRDRYLHSAQWNEPADTSNVKDSLDTEKHPVNIVHETRQLVFLVHSKAVVLKSTRCTN